MMVVKTKCCSLFGAQHFVQFRKKRKNDKRIKFCSTQCRLDYRKSNSYMKNYYKDNVDKWKNRQATEKFKMQKNSSQRNKYSSDPEYRKKVIERSKQYRIDHPLAKRKQDLRGNYNMSLEDYDELLSKQNGVCAICGRVDSGIDSRPKLYVDHNHSTLKVRGLLCASCNYGLGYFKDNPDLLLKAYEYLMKENDNE